MFTISDLFKVFCTRDCDVCGSFGRIYLSSVCLTNFCHEETSQIQPRLPKILGTYCQIVAWDILNGRDCTNEENPSRADQIG